MRSPGSVTPYDRHFDLLANPPCYALSMDRRARGRFE